MNRVAPYIRYYKMGDVVLYKHEGKTWISRITALGDDTIVITDGNVIVNGKSLKEDSVVRSWPGWKYGKYAIDEPFKVKANHVYLLSDKLSAQHDERS